MPGGNPSAEIDGRSMGQCDSLPLCRKHALVYNAINPGGLGAGPQLKSDRIPFSFLHKFP
jgi:hypothetical protein